MISHIHAIWYLVPFIKTDTFIQEMPVLPGGEYQP